MEGFADLSAGLKCGCYVLAWRGAIVYVGKSAKPFARLAKHLSSYRRIKLTKSDRVKGILFDRVWFRECGPGEMDELERSLIALHRPRYNTNLAPIERRRLDITIRGRNYTLNPDAPVSTKQNGLRRL